MGKKYSHIVEESEVQEASESAGADPVGNSTVFHNLLYYVGIVDSTLAYLRIAALVPNFAERR